MEYSKLSKEEKQNIFENVNNTHLKLTGDVKKALKRQFMSWKINKTIGAFELFIKLYESEDLYDSKNEWFKKLVDHDQLLKYICENDKYMSIAKYERHMRFAAQEREDLEQQLENIESGKGYITEQSHNEEIQELKKQHFQEIRELGDQIIKYRNESSVAREKLESERERSALLRIQHQKQIKGITDKFDQE